MDLIQQGPPKTVVVSLKNAHFGPPPPPLFFKLCVKQPTFSHSSPFFSVESAHKVTGGGGGLSPSSSSSSSSSPPSFHSSHVAVCSHGNMGGRGEETGWRKKEVWNLWKTWSRHDNCISLKLAALCPPKNVWIFHILMLVLKDLWTFQHVLQLKWGNCTRWRQTIRATLYCMKTRPSLPPPPSSTSVSARGDSLFFSLLLRRPRLRRCWRCPSKNAAQQRVSLLCYCCQCV